MTKMIKMSLVAAVAVAGLSTTASATPLEDSIKDVDFSGSLRYRYTNGESKDVDTNEYRLQVTTKAKVNEYVTAKVALNSKNSTADNTGGDADPDAAEIAEANFIVNAGGATVIVGKQALATPFADGSVDSQQGTGIVALYPVGPVTLAAGWYNNTDATTDVYGGADLGGNNITALGAIGAVDMVNFSVWYANVSESDLGLNTNGTNNGIEAGADAFNVNVDGTFGPVSVELNYAQVAYSLNNNAKNAGLEELTPKQTRLVASFDADVVAVTGGVILAGDEGANVDLGDGDAQSNFAMEAFDARDLTDTTAYYLGLSAPVGPVTLGLEYGYTNDIDGNTKGDVDFSETKLSASYAMSKNFTVSGWVTATSSDSKALDESGANRIEVKYTF